MRDNTQKAIDTIDSTIYTGDTTKFKTKVEGQLYSKHPKALEGSVGDLRPFRTSLNGKWMQTSAKTKAKELFKTKYAADLTVEDITKVLLEHERDTRYTAIDIIQSEETFLIEISESTFEERYVWVDGVCLDDLTRNIHNLTVGDKV